MSGTLLVGQHRGQHPGHVNITSKSKAETETLSVCIKTVLQHDSTALIS